MQSVEVTDRVFSQITFWSISNTLLNIFPMTPSVPPPKTLRQVQRIRHFNSARFGYARGFEKMVGLIHDAVKHVIDLLAVLFTLLPRGVRRYKNTFVSVQCNDAGKRFGDNSPIPAFKCPISICTPYHRNYRQTCSFGQIDDSQLGNEPRSCGSIGYQPAPVSFFNKRFHLPKRLSAST